MRIHDWLGILKYIRIICACSMIKMRLLSMMLNQSREYSDLFLEMPQHRYQNYFTCQSSKMILILMKLKKKSLIDSEMMKLLEMFSMWNHFKDISYLWRTQSANQESKLTQFKIVVQKGSKLVQKHFLKKYV